MLVETRKVLINEIMIAKLESDLKIKAAALSAYQGWDMTFDRKLNYNILSAEFTEIENQLIELKKN